MPGLASPLRLRSQATSAEASQEDAGPHGFDHRYPIPPPLDFIQPAVDVPDSLAVLRKRQAIKMSRKVQVANKQQLIAQPAHVSVADTAAVQPREDARAADLAQLAQSALEARVKWETKKMMSEPRLGASRRRPSTTSAGPPTPKARRSCSTTGWTVHVEANTTTSMTRTPILSSQFSWLMSVEQGIDIDEETNMAV